MAYTIMYSIVDEKGKTSTTEVKVPAATAWADAVLFTQELAELIAPLLTGAITRIGITRDVALPAGLAAAAAANSDGVLARCRITKL